MASYHISYNIEAVGENIKWGKGAEGSEYSELKKYYEKISLGRHWVSRTAVLPAARKIGQITQNSPNFKPRGREKFGPNFWPNFLFSRILAENSPNYQNSVLISILFTLGWPNLSNWDNVWLKTFNSFVYDQHNVCYIELGWANITS